MVSNDARFCIMFFSVQNLERLGHLETFCQEEEKEIVLGFDRKTFIFIKPFVGQSSFTNPNGTHKVYLKTI
jgi:hypothetical protein